MATAVPGFTLGDLLIDGPGERRRRVHMERRVYTVGRGEANELAFPEDKRLSREHLVLEPDDDGWTVRDVGSRNGSKLNGEPLVSRSRIKHGDHIAAGQLSMRFDLRNEFTNAHWTDIKFVEDSALTPDPNVSVDLRSAMANSSDVEGRPTLHSAHLGALVRAGRELVAQGSLDDLFRLVLDLSLDVAKAVRGAVFVNTPDGRLELRAVHGNNVKISTAVRDLVMNDRKSVIVRDARFDEIVASSKSIHDEGILSILAVPLQTDDRVIGLLYLDSPNQVRGFSSEDLNVVTVMANIAAIRIEHEVLIKQKQAKMLMDQELERAAQIQKAILPAKAPSVPGCELAGFNAACRTVGGDYYNFLEYADGRIAVFIADVSGKGMPAALLMSSLHACVQLLFEVPEPLAGHISRLNQHLAASCPANCFVTFFVATFDPASGQLTFCNAGHNPPKLIRADGTLENLPSTGLPLGIFRHAEYEQSDCVLDFDDVLLLFSDGVSEATGPSDEEDFGEERLIAAARQSEGLPAADVIESIRASVSAFTKGAPASDDTTLVVLRRSAQTDTW